MKAYSYRKRKIENKREEDVVTKTYNMSDFDQAEIIIKDKDGKRLTKKK